MSQRLSQRHTAMSTYDPTVPVRKERGKCISCLCMSWKFFTCVFSHVMLIALVVSYCILGAYTFQKLESENELQVKKGIPRIRENLTDYIWNYTSESSVLIQKNWTDMIALELQNFEINIVNAMRKDGWDGSENLQTTQWTFAGSLFYSIIVITTIGYGHIAPKTTYGKVTTIFYAILGIPLMLLCLSNIGDIMASSFRFLYWRVCCFVCTREPKRPRRARSFRGTVRQSAGTRSLPRGSVRRPERFSQRSHDSGIVPWAEPGMAHAYSDTDLRYSFMERSNYHLPDVESRGNSRHGPPARFNREGRDRFRDRHTVERERNVSKPNRYEDDALAQPRKYNTTGRINKDAQTPKQTRRNSRSMGLRSQSLDRKARKETPDVDFDRDFPNDSSVVCNKYAIDDMDRGVGEGGRNRPANRHSNRDRFQNRIRQNHNRSQSVPRPVAGNQLELPTPSPPRRTQSSYGQYHNDYNEDHEDCGNGAGGGGGEDMEMQPMRKSPRKKQRDAHPPSPRIMSPMGFQTHRQARYEDLPFYDDDPDYYDLPPRSRPVPIWLCVFLVVSYIITGAFIFSKWESWSLLDSAYFCFITLTTIGFGDFVPATGTKPDPNTSLAQCSLYLLFGIALLAMSFNLVQEEVIANVKGIARRLGILKEEEIND